MPKIFIDTNVFLDFYRIKQDSFQILKDLHQYSESIIFPSLVYDEFLRNRVNVIKEVVTKLKDEKRQFFIPAFFEDLGIFEELVKHQREYKKCLDVSISKLHEMIKDDKKDVVFSELSKLHNSEKIKIYEYDESIINKAQERHLLGNPPGTDTVKICDEVIWETILANIDDDIVIVARDSTYKDNYFYLSQEFYNITNKNLLEVTDSIKKGLKLLGKDISQEEIELEEKEIESLKWEKFLDARADAGWIGHTFTIKGKSGGWDPNLNKYEWVPLKDGYIKIDRDGAKMISSLDFDIATESPVRVKTTGSRNNLEALIKAYKKSTEWMRKKGRKGDQDPKTKSEDTDE